jgi:hypothetical protein
MSTPDYYVVKVGEDRYDLRQSRYRAQFEAGGNHPHDLMAVAFTAQGIRDLFDKGIFEGTVDVTALPPVEPKVTPLTQPGAFSAWDNPCPRRGW